MEKKPKVLAIASGGGHWVQLLRLRPAFEGCEVVFATVKEGYRADVEGAEFRVIPDSNRWDKTAMVRSALGILWLIIREKPDVVVSTGAAPGYFGVRFGKWLGARVIWIDSVANGEELSMCGKLSMTIAHQCWVQWEDLATGKSSRYFGAVL